MGRVTGVENLRIEVLKQLSNRSKQVSSHVMFWWLLRKKQLQRKWVLCLGEFGFRALG